MAQMEFDIPDKLFSGIGEKLEGIQKDMLYAAAPVYLGHAKRILSATIRHKEKSSGEMIANAKMSKVRKVKTGGVKVQLTFKGTNSEGTRNALKAFEMEYGNSRQPATPWIDALNSSAVSDVENAMLEVFEKEIQNDGF